ncbi:response regulator transcription factor [Undibacterium sp. Di24W]|uniref:response regulator transcription factor n=1 Tax=Undibacterium sp. Di24W TaxID=3413033 RepID=UPI003BEF4F5F
MSETRSLRVLIADDEANIVISLEYLMRKEGYQVATVADGEAALKVAAQFSPDLVLLDVMMPRKSGYEVCEALRANPAYAHSRIILLTACGRDSDIERGMALGADAYVTKPFSPRELMRKIRTIMT